MVYLLKRLVGISSKTPVIEVGIRLSSGGTRWDGHRGVVIPIRIQNFEWFDQFFWILKVVRPIKNGTAIGQTKELCLTK